MTKRIATAFVLAALAPAAPAAAQAATLEADRSCYGPGQKVGLAGIGFTPDGGAAVSVDGRQLGVAPVNPVGEFEVSDVAPEISAKQRTYVFSATDQTDPALTATAEVTVSSLAVKVTPSGRTDPAVKRRIVARGFTSGRTLWAHVKRARGKVRNIRVGRLKGACHTIAAKRRLFPRNAKPGAYTVQFDTKRKYSSKTRPNVTFPVTIFRYFKLSSASSFAATAPSWAPAQISISG